MKKKPAPGATLIARLKEQRLAREQELASKKQGQNGEPEATVHEQPEAKTEKHTAVVVADPIVEREHDAPAARAVATERTTVAVRQAPAGDLLHREIDIDDLRPNTDDYFVLTDEIRLAGRFAAVGLIAQGLRLMRLKDQAIYKDHYTTFEDYCRKEHQMSATYAYRLMRMSEMAERVAQIEQRSFTANAENMPDPFEVMISLGHRHLMALLPLEMETAQELLIKGLPVDQNNGAERLPLSKATEKQIKDALRAFMPASSQPKVATRVVEKKALVDEKHLVPALSKLIEMLEDWAAWLGGEAPQELLAARSGRGQLLTRLAKRFRVAANRIADALEGAGEAEE